MIKNNKETFKSLAGEFYKDTCYLSDLGKVYIHPSYYKIVGMGKEVVPFIIEHWEKEKTIDWSHALASITGIQTPVWCKSSRHNSAFWINWFYSNYFVPHKVVKERKKDVDEWQCELIALLIDGYKKGKIVLDYKNFNHKGITFEYSGYTFRIFKKTSELQIIRDDVTVERFSHPNVSCDDGLYNSLSEDVKSSILGEVVDSINQGNNTGRISVNKNYCTPHVIAKVEGMDVQTESVEDRVEQSVEQLGDDLIELLIKKCGQNKLIVEKSINSSTESFVIRCKPYHFYIYPESIEFLNNIDTMPRGIKSDKAKLLYKIIETMYCKSGEALSHSKLIDVIKILGDL